MDDRFRVVLVAESQERFAAEEAIAAVDGRLMFQASWRQVDQVLARLSRQMVLVLEMRGVDDAVLDDALALLAPACDVEDAAVVVFLSTEQIDLAAAHMMGGRTQFVVHADIAERIAAIALAAHSLDPARLSAAREGESERLRILHAEVARIANLLTRLSQSGFDGAADGLARTAHERRMGFVADPAARARVGAAQVRQIIRMRRARDTFLGPGLFEDPAWDMLLDLYAARLENTRVSVSSLCIAAAVPPTTALRWIAKMSDAGMLLRTPDPHDRRRAYMELAPATAEGMTRYFATLAEAGFVGDIAA